MATTLASLGKHFRPGNIWLRHEDPQAFVQCKFPYPKLYLSWRIFWSFYHMTWLLASLILTARDSELSVAKWFAYLSNLVYLILALECLMEAAIVAADFRGNTVSSLGSGNCPWYLKVTWLLYNLAATGSVMVTLWYWIWVFRDTGVTAVRVNFHGLSVLYVLANMTLTRFPFRLLHFLYPVLSGLVYTAFTAVYFCLGGTSQFGSSSIYPVLNWSKPTRTLAISSASNFLFIPIVHALLWCFAMLINTIVRRCTNNGIRLKDESCSDFSVREREDSIDTLDCDIA